MRIACLQLSGQDLADPMARRSATMRVADPLADVDLIVLPELWPVGFFHFADYADSAEPLDGPTVEFAVGLAREHGCWVHGGSFIERGTIGTGGVDQLHNTSVLVNPAGEVSLLYRKNHLFGYESQESRLLVPGTEAPVVDVEGLRVGAATCYDLRFPELFRSMLDEGAELFCITSAWPESRLSHWRTLCQARAVENLAWLVACNAAGTDNGVALAGHSIVVDPWGTVIAEAGADPGVLLAEIDAPQVRKIRTEYPFLSDRRP
jgi:predicted amidohydrolase